MKTVVRNSQILTQNAVFSTLKRQDKISNNHCQSASGINYFLALNLMICLTMLVWASHNSLAIKKLLLSISSCENTFPPTRMSEKDPTNTELDNWTSVLEWAVHRLLFFCTCIKGVSKLIHDNKWILEREERNHLHECHIPPCKGLQMLMSDHSTLLAPMSGWKHWSQSLI